MSEKPLEPKDRSPAVSPLDTDLGDKEEDEEDEEEEEEEGEREPSVRRNSTGRRCVASADGATEAQEVEWVDW